MLMSRFELGGPGTDMAGLSLGFHLCGAQKVCAKNANNESQAAPPSPKPQRPPQDSASSEALELPSLHKILGWRDIYIYLRLPCMHNNNNHKNCGRNTTEPNYAYNNHGSWLLFLAKVFFGI